VEVDRLFKKSLNTNGSGNLVIPLLFTMEAEQCIHSNFPFNSIQLKAAAV